MWGRREAAGGWRGGRGKEIRKEETVDGGK